MDGTSYQFSLDRKTAAGGGTLSIEKADGFGSKHDIHIEHGVFPALGSSKANETLIKNFKRVVAAPHIGERLSGQTLLRLSSIARQIREERDSAQTGSEAMAAALALQFMTIITRAAASGPQESPRVPDGVWSIADAILYIEENYGETFSLEFFVSKCALNVSDFSRRFKEKAGCPLFEFINRARIKRACALLKSSDMPIIEISSEVGYNNLSFFNRYFLRIMGISPRAFRLKST